MQMHEARIVEWRALTPAVRHVTLRLERPGLFAFRPGQFIQFVLGPKTLRMFSLASPPNALPDMDLCVDVSPGGAGSQFIEGLSAGDVVSFRGPFGVFTVSEQETRPLEFVATGAGIAPIRSMIARLFESEQPSTRRATLTFGNRIAADLLYDAEWRALAERTPAFRYHPTLSKPDAPWSGLRGRVTDVIQKRSPELVGRVFFLCGSPQMIDDMRKVLVDLSVPEVDIHFEKFF